MSIARVRHKTLTERMVVKVGPKYSGYWERRESNRQLGEMMRPIMEDMAKSLQVIEEQCAAKRELFFSPGAKIGSSLGVRVPVVELPKLTMQMLERELDEIERQQTLSEQRRNQWLGRSKT